MFGRLELSCAIILISGTISARCVHPLCDTKILLAKNRNQCIIAPVSPHRRGVRVVTYAGRDAMDAGCVARRAAQSRTVKPRGPVPPTLGTTPGSKARGDGG